MLQPIIGEESKGKRLAEADTKPQLSLDFQTSDQTTRMKRSACITDLGWGEGVRGFFRNQKILYTERYSKFGTSYSTLSFRLSGAAGLLQRAHGSLCKTNPEGCLDNMHVLGPGKYLLNEQMDRYSISFVCTLVYFIS